MNFVFWGIVVLFVVVAWLVAILSGASAAFGDFIKDVKEVVQESIEDEGDNLK